MKSCRLLFKYLGNRDYLDISSITESFWSAFGNEKRELISDLEFKLKRQIHTQCDLVYDEIGNIDGSLKEKAYAELSWKIQGRAYQGFFLGTDEVITARDPEANLNFADYCEFEGQKVRLIKLFRDDTCYNLMKMGKYLVSQSYDPQVKVVKYSMQYFMPASKLIGAEMKLSELPGGQFLKLSCSKDGAEFGYIVIRKKL